MIFWSSLLRSQIWFRCLKALKVQKQKIRYSTTKWTGNLQHRVDDICIFKSDRHKVLAVTKDKEIVFYGKLNDVVGKVPPQFLLIHKSYLINRDYVIRYTFEFIEMKNHDMLPISKAYQKEVRDKLCCRGEMLEWVWRTFWSLYLQICLEPMFIWDF